MMPVAVKLAPSKSYPTRRALFLPVFGEMLSDGVLTIVTESKSGRGPIESYALQADDGGYLLLKRTGGEVYRVAGKRCTCPAGNGGKGCKHVDSVASLKAAGAL